jgi:DNA invertase Pin-like site-specific DNA recombinase
LWQPECWERWERYWRGAGSISSSDDDECGRGLGSVGDFGILDCEVAWAQAQAEATKATQKAGIAHAKQWAEVKYKGRKPRSYTRAQFDLVRTMLDRQRGIGVIAKAADLSRQAIYRIEQDPAAAEAVLATWGEWYRS